MTETWRTRLKVGITSAYQSLRLCEREQLVVFLFNIWVLFCLSGIKCWSTSALIPMRSRTTVPLATRASHGWRTWRFTLAHTQVSSQRWSPTRTQSRAGVPILMPSHLTHPHKLKGILNLEPERWFAPAWVTVKQHTSFTTSPFFLNAVFYIFPVFYSCLSALNTIPHLCECSKCQFLCWKNQMNGL